MSNIKKETPSAELSTRTGQQQDRLIDKRFLVPWENGHHDVQELQARARLKGLYHSNGLEYIMEERPQVYACI